MTLWMFVLGLFIYLVIGGIVGGIAGALSSDLNDNETIMLCAFFWPAVVIVFLVFVLGYIPIYTAKFLMFCGRCLFGKKGD